MLGKCFKYEFKSFARLLVPMMIACFAANALLFFYITMAFSEDSFFGIFTFIGLIPLVFITTIGGIIVCFIQAPRRFYAAMLSKEAYLIRTLPVSAHIYMLAILLNSLLWFVITFTMLLLSFTMPPFSDQYSISSVLAIADIWKELFDLSEQFNILNLVSFYLCGQIVVMTGITIGSIVGKGKKLIIALFIYISYNVVSLAGSFAVGIVYAIIGEKALEEYSFHVMCIFAIAAIIGGYFLIMSLIKNKADVY